MSSSLLYMGISSHQNQTIVHQPKTHKMIVDPQKVFFYLSNYDNKTMIFKMSIKNDYPSKIVFKIIQPKKSTLSVKCKKYSLNSKQLMQIFVFLNAQKQKTYFQDQFVIYLEKQKVKVHVPITCKIQTQSKYELNNQTYENNQKSKIQRSFSSSKRNPLKLVDNYYQQKSSNALSLSKKSINLQGSKVHINTSANTDFNSKKLILKKRSIVGNQFGSLKSSSNNSRIQKIIGNFEKHYHRIVEFVKQKNVKKQIFIGEKAVTQLKQRQIQKFKRDIKQYISDTLRYKVQNRKKFEYSQQGPIVRNFQGVILRWSKDKNIPKITYEKGLSKVQQYVRKYLVDLRFQKIHKIFKIYKQFQSQKEHQNLPSIKRHQIYVEKLHKKLNQKHQMNLQLGFQRTSVSSQKIDLQYDTNTSKSEHTFEINPRIGFDNWVAIQQSTPYYHQIMSYKKKQQIPDWLCYPKLNQNHQSRLTKGQINHFQNIDGNYSQNINLDTNLVSSQQLDNILDSISLKKIKYSNQIITDMSNSNDNNISSKNISKNSLSHKNSSQQVKMSSNFLGSKNMPMKQLQAQNRQKQIYQKRIRQSILDYANFTVILKEAHRLSEDHIRSKQSIFSSKQNTPSWREREIQIQIQKNYKINFQMKERFHSLYPEKILKPFIYYQSKDYHLQLQQNSKYNRMFQQSFGNNKQGMIQSQQIKSEQQFELNVIKQISVYRYNIQYLNNLIFQRQKFQPYKQLPNEYFVEKLLSYQNKLIYSIPKQDKYEFDRLQQKSERLLQWIQNNTDSKQLKKGKIKGQIDIQIPIKNKIKNLNNLTYEKSIQSIKMYKKTLMSKSNYLDIFLQQIGKNKTKALIHS